MSNNDSIHISIIIPCYNAEKKIQKCIHSLKKIQFPQNKYEVIFVDDFSSDNTIGIINSEIKEQKNWFLHTLKKNSGSPSKPRNKGTSLANGEYIFFLDSDDEITPASLQKQYTIAKQENACIVRGSLIVDINGKRAVTNQIHDFPYDADKDVKVKKIISTQSTTAPSLVKKSLLTINSISWEEKIHLGEDTLFLIDVFDVAVNISYLDDVLFIYNKTIQKEASSTQIYGARELKSHLYVWLEAEKRLSKFGFSYFKVRGRVALNTSFQGISVYYQNDINPELFEEFSIFINTHSETVSKLALRPRFNKALQHLRLNQYHEFFHTLKPQILTATDDLYDYLIDVIPNDHCKQVNSLKLARQYIEKGMNPRTVLDFGSGAYDSSKFFNAILPDIKWFEINLDFLSDTKNIDVAINNIYTSDESTFPCKHSSFDLIYSNQALEHILEPRRALSKIADMLSKDGFFIGETSQFNPGHSMSCWNFTIYGFKRAIEKAGMKIIELRPSIDGFSLIKRSYTSDFDKYNKYFRVESPINIDIQQIAREKQQSNSIINYRKLMYCGQFSFVCKLQ